MGKIKQPELTEVQGGQLSKGFHNGVSHCLRMRCRAVPLKAEGLSSAQAGKQTDMSLVSVNARVKRFLPEGITGLQTRPGRGRKPVMNRSDGEAVRAAIERDRQSVSKAGAAWQEVTEKEAGDLTFKRFYQHWRKIQADMETPGGNPLAAAL
ncbi:MAG: helix-turn-helix domain-containing protein [Dysgonamonadaceae bacterium]|jgi:transposase|nr:helix-turn-helix domain-containing protein [Dysgonamonadaceae bacterium]